MFINFDVYILELCIIINVKEIINMSITYIYVYIWNLEAKLRCEHKIFLIEHNNFVRNVCIKIVLFII